MHLHFIRQPRESAELAGIGDITGSIEKGKAADLIVTAKNPLDDLRALRNVDMVVARGTIIDHPKIKKEKTRWKQNWINSCKILLQQSCK